MKWLALVLSPDATSASYCSAHPSAKAAEAALVRYRQETAVGFGTQFVIAEVRFAISE